MIVSSFTRGHRFRVNVVVVRLSERSDRLLAQGRRPTDNTETLGWLRVDSSVRQQTSAVGVTVNQWVVIQQIGRSSWQPGVSRVFIGILIILHFGVIVIRVDDVIAGVDCTASSAGVERPMQMKWN